MVLPLYLAREINGWGKDIEFVIPNIMLTTLDKNTGSEKSIGKRKSIIMTQPFLQTIDDLRHTVKVNASFKFEILEPYLQDAFDRYIVPYLGEAWSIGYIESR